MKKYIVPSILTTLTLMLTGCGRSPARIPLSELPADYSLEQAKEDGCVIHENGDVTQGKGLRFIIPLGILPDTPRSIMNPSRMSILYCILRIYPLTEINIPFACMRMERSMSAIINIL